MYFKIDKKNKTTCTYMYNTEPQFLILLNITSPDSGFAACSPESYLILIFCIYFHFQAIFFQETAIFDSFCIVNNLQPFILVAYEARIWFIS